jgi:D-hydroxyproline dehydrogenase subunit gamma
VAARISPSADPVAPGPSRPLTIEVDGVPVAGLAGQTIAGILLAAGRASWRTSRRGRPRGVFCGIGICHDCLLTVNGLPDVRACQRRATDGDAVTTTDSVGRPTAAESEAATSTGPTDPADTAGPAGGER